MLDGKASTVGVQNTTGTGYVVKHHLQGLVTLKFTNGDWSITHVRDLAKLPPIGLERFLKSIYSCHKLYDGSGNYRFCLKAEVKSIKGDRIAVERSRIFEASILVKEGALPLIEETTWLRFTNMMSARITRAGYC